MRCPFLREATALFCDVEPTHMLPIAPDAVDASCPCVGTSERPCPFVRSGDIDHVERDVRGRCTRLHERRVLACDAAARREYVPYVQGLLSRCQSDGYRYCPLFLARETPAARLRDVAVEVDDLIVATDRAYSPNHWWVDESELGTCVLGVDDLLRFVLPHLDVVHFVSRPGIDRPHVVLAGGDVHVELELPVRVEILSKNVHARREPAAVLRDPYGAGWLFEVRSLQPRERLSETRGFVSGDSAPAWMAAERRRLEEFARAHADDDPHGAGYLGSLAAADGGRSAPGLLGRLGPVDQARLEHEFLRWRIQEVES